MELQTAFYIVGIVFMGLMLILFICLMIAVLVIRAKVVSIHRAIEDKFDTVRDVTSKATALVGAVKEVADHIHRKK